MSEAAARGPLDGYLVVDLSSGIAGAYCTRLLADGGAAVVKVEPPEGDALRSWTASGEVPPAGRDAPLFSYLAGGKQSVVFGPDGERAAADLDELLDRAHAVVWSPGPAGGVAGDSTPASLLSAHPHLAVAAITPFGLNGPWQDRPATEFTLQAWSGGIVGLGRGAPDRAPVHVGGQVGEWLSGVYAAIGIQAALARARQTGAGQLIDLSMLEVAVLCLTYYPVTFFETLHRPWRSERSLFQPGVAAAKDGLVALGCGTAQQWFDLCAMVGHPEWIDPAKPVRIGELTAQRAPELREWVADHTVADTRDLATAFRIPNAPVSSGATVIELEQMRERGVFRRNPTDEFLQPAGPYRLSPDVLLPAQPAPRTGEHSGTWRDTAAAARPRPCGSAAGTQLPYAGLRVLDLTAFWAGPSATHILAMLGAEVIHVESTTRPDGARMIAGIPVTEDQWWEKCPIFRALNTNKKSVTVDFQTERGLELLKRLIASSDVIVENYTPRVLDQIGLDYDRVRALRPDIVMVRMPGFGLTGPMRENPAFAYVIEDAAGLTWLTGYPDDNPVEPYSLGDPNAGLHALNGLLLALEHRRRTGQGVLVEAAMVEAAISIAAAQPIEFSAFGALLQRDGNRGPLAAPQNLYRSADTDEFGRLDAWVAVAVATDEQWAALAGALGHPAWAADPELSAAAGRRARHDVIDEHLAAWCADRTRDEIVETLWGAGVPVAKVMQPHRQAELPPLQARGFFELTEHPVGPPARQSTIPMRLSDGPARFHRSPAPLLGEHNHEVLTELGVNAAEIAELEAAGIIGRAPRMR
ncbi:CoA transferase [Trebonia kvetii]|uniref:CoA transferase n=1 Tax=Trebonia kvetii TaxID=2480626 RepID=A0A6P2C822_9ACTN|nr:CoA transferase [Trebonia kvetii]TVZ06645.1 CoA transferase [Trebonia kvetii]